MDTWIHI